MVRERTNTSEYPTAEAGVYDCVTVEKVKKKIIKEVYHLYEWSFSTVVGEEIKTFTIGLFSSGMGDLLRAMGCNEVKKNEFDWDTDEVVGNNVAFTLSYMPDKSGKDRPVLSDVKKAGPKPVPTPKANTVAWDE